MDRVVIDEVEPDVLGDADRRLLTDAIDTSELAVAHYRLAPGERASGLHAHHDQEEAFVVLDGVATFETLDGEVAVGAGEVVRFAPGEYHSGAIADGSAVSTLALGAPRDSEEVRIPLSCPGCGHDARRPGIGEDGETPVLVCPACGTDTEATCPACGGVEMQAVTAEDGSAVGVCRDSGAVSMG